MSTKRKKLRLDVDELKVEAFETAEGALERGTVRGRESDLATQCNNDLSCPCTRQELSCSGDHICFCNP